ncbi:MAG: porin [Longimicrobiales bacterium]
MGRGRFGVALVQGLAWVAVAVPVRAQSANGVEIRLTGRLQYQFNTTSVDEADLGGPIAASTFETRRVRLGVNLEFAEWLTALIEPEYALARLQLRQAWVNLGIDPRFELQFGQFKKPFSLWQLTSSTVHPLIERAVRIRGLHDVYGVLDEAGASPLLGRLDDEVVLGEEQELLDRMGYDSYDMGAVAHGEIGRFSYTAGVFNGTGSDTRDNTDGKGITARATVQLLEETPLVIGAGVSHQEIMLDDDAPANGTAFEVDAELGAFRRRGVHILAEAVTGTNLAVDETFRAAQAMIAWFAPTRGRIEGVEPLGRVSWGDPNDEIDGDEGLLLTPGLNLYFVGRTRLMFNWDVFVPAGDRFETVSAMRAQAQVAF